MSSGREHGKTVFQTEWLTDKRFKLWLGPGKKSNEATCRHYHNSTINVEKMGLYSLLCKREKTEGNSRFLPPCIQFIFFQCKPFSTKNLHGQEGNLLYLITQLFLFPQRKLRSIRWALKVVDYNVFLEIKQVFYRPYFRVLPVQQLRICLNVSLVKHPEKDVSKLNLSGQIFKFWIARRRICTGVQMKKWWTIQCRNFKHQSGEKGYLVRSIRTVLILFFFISNVSGMVVTLVTTCNDVASYFMTFGSPTGFFNKLNLVFIGPLAGRVL